MQKEEQMTAARIPLAKIDEAQITIVMDNSIDVLMQSTETVRRFAPGANWHPSPLPIAEHGFSALIQVKSGEKSGTVLLDTGGSEGGVAHNLNILGIDAKQIEAIVMSHGHFDHAMGLPSVIERIGRPGLKIVLHPDAFLERKAILPNGSEVGLSVLQASELRRKNVDIVETKDPSLLLDNMMLVSGEIARTTDFEKGFPIHHAKLDGVWQSDPLIKDDQCVILNIREKGLVIITGCGHAGIINTIRYAQNLIGISDIYAVVGGFHLTGGLFEKIIPDTVQELQRINPRYVLPNHCTGWSALNKIAQGLPHAFIASSVGTTLVL
jgi:7,8-dihydropterin-6-yl-methyl-4-(beta-D-ribofuranosyl)aminobenzene 5'-phosphate synthase